MIKVNMINRIERRTFDRKVLEKPKKSFRLAGFLAISIMISGLSFAVVFINMR